MLGFATMLIIYVTNDSLELARIGNQTAVPRVGDDVVLGKDATETNYEVAWVSWKPEANQATVMLQKAE